MKIKRLRLITRYIPFRGPKFSQNKTSMPSCRAMLNGSRVPQRFTSLLPTFERFSASDEDVEAGWKTALSSMAGEAGEQAVFFFSDYRMENEIRLEQEHGVNRVFLFLPENSHARYRFRMTGSGGNVQIAMPILQWSLETLMKPWTESMWSGLMTYMNLMNEE